MCILLKLSYTIIIIKYHYQVSVLSLLLLILLLLLFIALSATFLVGAWENGVASHCIDGVTTYNAYWPGSLDFICHSSGEGDTLVITVTGYNVDKVIVYNRLDLTTELQYRILRYDLQYTNDFGGQSVIYQSSFGGTVLSTYTFHLNQKFVSIVSSTYIALTEVELYYNNVKIPTTG